MDQGPGRRDHVGAVALTRGGLHNLDCGVRSKDEQRDDLRTARPPNPPELLKHPGTFNPSVIASLSDIRVSAGDDDVRVVHEGPVVDGRLRDRQREVWREIKRQERLKALRKSTRSDPPEDGTPRLCGVTRCTP